MSGPAELCLGASFFCGNPTQGWRLLHFVAPTPKNILEVKFFTISIVLLPFRNHFALLGMYITLTWRHTCFQRLHHNMDRSATRPEEEITTFSFKMLFIEQSALLQGPRASAWPVDNLPILHCTRHKVKFASVQINEKPKLKIQLQIQMMNVEILIVGGKLFQVHIPYLEHLCYLDYLKRLFSLFVFKNRSIFITSTKCLNENLLYKVVLVWVIEDFELVSIYRHALYFQTTGFVQHFWYTEL